MDSGFHTVDSEFDVLDSEFFFSGDWIPDSNRKQDSLSRIPDYRAQNSGFHDTNFLDSGSHEQKFPDSGIWIPLQGAKSNPALRTPHYYR